MVGFSFAMAALDNQEGGEGAINGPRSSSTCMLRNHETRSAELNERVVRKRRELFEEEETTLITVIIKVSELSHEVGYLMPETGQRSPLTSS
jgi:hypothetical protein